MAAQHKTVTIDNVTLRLVMECAGRGFRSQHRDIKYSSRQKSEMMIAAAGIDPNRPRLYGCVGMNINMLISFRIKKY